MSVTPHTQGIRALTGPYMGASDLPPDEDELRSQYAAWIRDQRWQFAKTYATSSPHEYLVKNWLSGEDETIFEALVMFIRRAGYDEQYNGNWYTCMDIDGHKYWTMGEPLDQTDLINRRSYQGYDLIAELTALGEDPANYLDITEYDRGEYYGAATRPDDESGDA